MAYTHADLARALSRIAPAGWSLSGDALDGLVWPDHLGPRPTEADVAAALVEMDALGYRERRAAAYPPMGELADALVKIHSGDPALAAEGEAQLGAYVAACLRTKSAHPKPAQE